MQTFLPYSDFERSAQCLDMKRLGKQRVEGYQLLLIYYKGSRRDHNPAYLMWKDNIESLAYYTIVICNEWVKRGYKDTVKNKILGLVGKSEEELSKLEKPKWLGDGKFHASHRSNLLRKYFEWYNVFNWDESDNLEYVWPVRIHLN
jgi:hypothetical protein